MSQSSRYLERVLRRSDINRGQITLLKYLYELDDEYVGKKELIDEIRWGDHDSFDGVLAVFSTRINNTEGISGKPGYTAFIEQKNIDGKEHYRLRREGRATIDRIPELLDVFEKPMDELLEGARLEIEDFSLSEKINEDEELESGWSPSSLEDRLLAG